MIYTFFILTLFKSCMHEINSYMLGLLKSTHYETENKIVMWFSIAIMPHLHGNSLINIFCNESGS